MSTGKIKKSISIMVCIVLMLVVNMEVSTITVDAATSTSKVPIICYVKSTSGNVTTYKSINGAYSGYICPNDQCTILNVYSSGWVCVKYPVSKGYKIAYTQSDNFFTNVNFSTNTTSTGKNMTVYKKSNLSSSIGTVYANDTILVIGTSNNNTQIIYPVSNGYKMGFISGGLQNTKSNSSSEIADLCFDYQYYTETYSDLKAAFGYNQAALYNHWINYGIKEGRSGSPVLDLQYYIDNNEDLKNAFGNNYTAAYNHFLTYGYKEFRNSSKYYFGEYYKNHNSDLRNFDSKFLLQHYVQYGIKEGRYANTERYSESYSCTNQRSTVVNYMNKMATIEWTPKTSFIHWSGGRTWYAGTTYKGVPYSQSTRDTTYEKFVQNMSGKQYVGSSGQKTYLGSDCSSAVSMAWKQVNPSFPITSTYYMYPKQSYINAVGNYSHWNLSNASIICRKNGLSVMKKAYSALQPGDAVLQNEHVMLVTGVYSNYITVTEQTTYNSSLKSTWRVNRKVTFDTLYSSGYIPITLSTW